MSNQKLNMGRIVSIAGALIAFLIGSGFATGQEIMQYYSTYGYWGIAVVLLVLALLIFISLFLLEMGHRHQFVPDNEIYIYADNARWRDYRNNDLLKEDIFAYEEINIK